MFFKKVLITKKHTFDIEQCVSSRIFENIPQNGPEYSHRNLAIARVLVTAVTKNIGGLLSWLVSLSSSVPELTRHGLETGPPCQSLEGGGCCKSVVPFVSLALRVIALVISLSCQILVMFEAHWHSPQARARLGGGGVDEVRGVI